MGNKGRYNNTTFGILDWSWWTGLFGLLLTIICFASLIGIVFAIEHSLTSQKSTQHSQKYLQNLSFSFHFFCSIKLSNGSTSNPISSSYPHGANFPINSNSYPDTSNAMMPYGSNHYHYDQNQNINPQVSHLAQQYVWESNPNNQFIQHYGQSILPQQYYDTYL
jgi:hypothetical protein